MTAACDDCDWTGPESEIKCPGDVPRLSERLDPGGTVPAGECPKCGALAYLEERNEGGAQ
jgi:hypothetical protein